MATSILRLTHLSIQLEHSACWRNIDLKRVRQVSCRAASLLWACVMLTNRNTYDWTCMSIRKYAWPTSDNAFFHIIFLHFPCHHYQVFCAQGTGITASSVTADSRLASCYHQHVISMVAMGSGCHHQVYSRIILRTAPLRVRFWISYRFFFGKNPGYEFLNS